MMVSTETLQRELATRGFVRLMRWSHGVDCALFRPRVGSIFELPRPIFLTRARVAIEKNLDAFLSLDLPGSKVVVGDGPAMKTLQTRFPGAHFVGEMGDERLAAAYASADVFVFPSLTDTFGLVLIEALASGLPVAAYPVVGPLEVIGDSGAGVLDADLGRAALAALAIPRELARARALSFSPSESARQFVENVFSVHRAAATPRRGRRVTDMNSKDPTAVDEMRPSYAPSIRLRIDTSSLSRDAAEPSAEVQRLPRSAFRPSF